MIQEHNDLLLKDLCARLPYGVKGLVTFNGNHFMTQHQVEDRTIDGKLYDRFAVLQSSWYDNVTIKPYLFPLSSMTEEQYNSLHELGILGNCSHSYEYVNPHIHGVSFIFKQFKTYSLELIEWLNKNHFDYRGLIPMGLAIDATDKNIY